MTRARGPRYTTLALVILGLACGDAPTAPAAGPETVLVSLAGVAADDAGIVLELTGGLDDIESTRASLELEWARDAAGATTVVIVGPLSGGGELLRIRRRAGLEPLRVQVREVAAEDGTVSSPSSVHATLRMAPVS
jgi:hypothetical protein